MSKPRPFALVCLFLGLLPRLLWAADAPLSTAVSVPLTVKAPAAGKLSVAIRDAQGKHVRTLAALQEAKAGDNALKWDGLDDQGQPVPVGDYQALWLTGNVQATFLGYMGNGRVPRNKDTYPMNGAMVVGLDVDPAGDALYACYGYGERQDHVAKYDLEGNVIWKGGRGGTGPLCVYQDRIYGATSVLADSKGGPQRWVDRIEVCQTKDGVTVRPPGWPRDPLVSSPHPASTVGLSDLEAHGVLALAAFDGKLYLPLYWENRIAIRDLVTFAEVGSIPNVPQPKGLAVGPWGLAVVAADEVWVYSPALELVRAVGPFCQPWALDADAQGALFVTELGGVARNSEREITKEGWVTGHFVGREGQINRVVKISPAGQVEWERGWLGPLSGEVLPDKLYGAVSVAAGPNGDYYVGEFFMNRVRGFDAAGQERWQLLGNAPTFPDPRDPTIWWGGALSQSGWGLVRYKVNLDTLDYAPDRWYGQPTVSGPYPLATVVSWPNVMDTFTFQGRTYLAAGQTFQFLSFFDITDAGDPTRREIPMRAFIGQGLTLPVNGVRSLPHWGWWVDQNGNERPDPGEYDLATGIDYGFSRFAAPGHVVVTVHSGEWAGRLLDLPMLSLTRCQAPLFRPDPARTIMQWKPDEVFPGQACVDAKGNWWIRATRNGEWGNALGPHSTHENFAQMRRYTPEGKLLWAVGKKAIGRKDPGEFYTGGWFTDRMTLLDDKFVFAGDASGQVDILNEDGLWAGLLLKDGHLFGGDTEVDPYVLGGGEPTHLGVHRLGNRVIFLNYDAGGHTVRLFHITGLDGLKQGRLPLRLGRQAQAGPAPAAPEEVTWQVVCRLRERDRNYVIDGKLDEWRLFTPTVLQAEGAPTAKFVFRHDAQYLYVALQASGDPNPAMNKYAGKDTYDTAWDGSALELFLCTDPAQPPTAPKYTDKHFQFFIPFDQRDTTHQVVLRQGDRVLGWVPDSQTAFVIQDRQKGEWTAEVAIPWACLPDFTPQPNVMYSFNLAMNWGSAGGTRAFQTFWTPGSSYSFGTPAVWKGELEIGNME